MATEPLLPPALVESLTPELPTPLQVVLKGCAYVRQSALARALGVDAATVKRLVEEGILPLPVDLGVEGVHYPVPPILEWERRRLSRPRTRAQREFIARKWAEVHNLKGARGRAARAALERLAEGEAL